MKFQRNFNETSPTFGSSRNHRVCRLAFTLLLKSISARQILFPACCVRSLSVNLGARWRRLQPGQDLDGRATARSSPTHSENKKLRLKPVLWFISSCFGGRGVTCHRLTSKPLPTQRTRMVSTTLTSKSWPASVRGEDSQEKFTTRSRHVWGTPR